MLRHVFIFLFAVIFANACSEAILEEPPLNDQAESSIESTADSVWAALTQPSLPLAKTLGEGRLAYFMRSVELERQRFRRDGLHFWETYPEDPRRYTWLILTTYMSPDFPADLVAWAAEEERLGPNLADVDEEAHSAWADQYQVLRCDFMESNEVTDLQRRQLRSAEIYQQHFRARYHRQRGEPSLSNEALLDLVVDFLVAFPAPFDGEGLEPVAYAWDRDRVVAPLLGWVGLTGTPGSLSETLTQRLEAAGVDWHAPYAGIVEGGEYQSRLIRFQLQSHRALAESFVENGFEGWADWRAAELSDDSVLFAIYASSLTFPSFNRMTGDMATGVIANHDIHMSVTKFRELGLIHFEAMTLDGQVSWIDDTSWRSTFWLRSPIHIGFLPDAERGRTRFLGEDHIDIDAAIESYGELSAKFPAMMSEAELTKEQGELLRFRQLNAGFLFMSQAWIVREDRSFVDAKLAQIEQAAERGDDVFAADFAGRLVRPDGESYEYYGLTDTDLGAFLVPFLTEGGPAMQALAEGFIDRVNLEPAISVSIQAPTLDGERTVGVEDFEGQIVLVDNWDTNCAPCIAAFPRVQEIYDRYRDQGFEIMSIAYDGESQHEQIARIKTRLGLSWETLNGEGLWGAVSSRYRFTGFPQYLLLDREGRYVAGNDEIHSNWNEFEALLDDLIAKDGTDFYNQAPAIWRVADEDTTLHLFGTIHSVKPGFEWWNEELEQAAQSADIVYFEIPRRIRPTPDRFAELEAQYFRNAPGVRLSDSLTPEQAEQVRSAFVDAGFDWQEVQTFTIDYAVAQLGQARRAERGVHEGESAEARVAQALRGGRNDEERGFASYEQQMAYFANISAQGQVNYLMNALEDDGGADFDRLFEAWRTGDVETLTEIGVIKPQADIPEAYQALVVDRNAAWAEELDRVLEEETGSVFVAVGAGHLVGPDSLQAMLAERGHQAERVQ